MFKPKLGRFIAATVMLGTVLFQMGCTPTPEKATGEIGLAIDAAWVRPAGSGSATAGYFVIRNNGPLDDRLLGADVAIGSASIHRTIHEDGIARMREVPEGLVIATGETLAFEPLAYHVMIAELSEALEAGDDLDITLHFERAGAILVQAAIADTAPE